MNLFRKFYDIEVGENSSSFEMNYKLPPVSVVTIKNKIPLFRDGIEATSIELIELNETGFEIVSQKDLYKIGDKAIYIQPDYSLSDLEIFHSFTQPNGDPKKSRLGSKNRVRAIKFNFNKENKFDPVYSNGILLPYMEVYKSLNPNDKDYPELWNVNLQKELGIVKWEEAEPTKPGVFSGNSSQFPKGLYKTDEDNINNKWKHFESILPNNFVLSKKYDGSSITLWYKDGKCGIASRNQGKPLTFKKVVGRRNKKWFEYLMFWKSKFDLNKYEEVSNDSDFVKYGKPYLDLLKFYCENIKLKGLVLRGELCGQGSKGSGNKNNPEKNTPTDIYFFGVDYWNDNECERGDEEQFNLTIDHLNEISGMNNSNVLFKRCKTIGDNCINIHYIESKNQLVNICENYFKENLIEGIVVRSTDGKFSSKYICNEYDSKK